ncbi:MAG: STAS/SEC14 domain-containing protein [Chitinophagaceae bacterium]|nr:STAS/SEC14 domain-containing protein [Chitinophagaceae bacterium]
METKQPKIYDIYYDAAKNFVVMRWNGYATSAQFREGTEYMLQVLTAHGASKVLADIRDMVLIGMEDQHWLDTDFLPRAIAAGFRAIAMVKPLHYFNKVAVETVSYKVDREKLAISFFENPEEAEAWLQTV